VVLLKDIIPLKLSNNEMHFGDGRVFEKENITLELSQKMVTTSTHLSALYTQLIFKSSFTEGNSKRYY